MRQHRLRFSIWAAFRAAQAGSAKAKGAEFTAALQNSGLVEFLDEPSNHELNIEEFDKHHQTWVKRITQFVHDRYEKAVSYGIGAKFTNVFVKSYFLLAGNERTSLASAAHPPIDSYLLRGLDRLWKTSFAREYKWQKLDERAYWTLIREMRKRTPKGAPLWALEQYWKLD